MICHFLSSYSGLPLLIGGGHMVSAASDAKEFANICRLLLEILAFQWVQLAVDGLLINIEYPLHREAVLDSVYCRLL